MVTEYSKPWNYDKVWYDHNDETVVVKLKTGHIMKWKSYCDVKKVDDNRDGPVFVEITDINENNKPREEKYNTLLEIDDRCNGDFIEGLKKAFKHFERKIFPFLCPSCKYGQLIRTVKSAEGIPYDTEYGCFDMSKKREYSPEIQKILDEDKKIPRLPYEHTFQVNSILDYANGPGGWDGKTCPNYIKADCTPTIKQWTITNNSGKTITT